MKIRVQAADPAQRKAQPPAGQLGFGRQFTDHMLLWNYDPAQRWHDPRIVPYQPLSLDPACMTLHYAQQIFEGIKAYHGDDGGLRIFRLAKYVERMQRSARRMCMPPPEAEGLQQAIRELVLLDRAWVPADSGSALYIRPNMIATDPYLGVHPSQSYLLYVILGPVGAYYAEGFNPISILVEDRYVRAAQGGVGEAKTGGNYAATLLSQLDAKRQGYTQVLWLDGRERRYVEEVGTMNIFFRLGDEVITSPLTGTVLPGVTRDSVLQVLREWGDCRVTERPLAIDEVVEAANAGRLREVFGTGTAAVVSPVGQFAYKGQVYRVGDGQTGPLSRRLFDHINDLQHGRVADPLGWAPRIDT
ncbi:MAG: branched-chain amino acid aminotransferase [Proteobacteria bacterium]|nr:branched-chain amino acid aminotransferase [Pseudomonadota bacterium]